MSYSSLFNWNWPEMLFCLLSSGQKVGTVASVVHVVLPTNRCDCLLCFSTSAPCHSATVWSVLWKGCTPDNGLCVTLWPFKCLRLAFTSLRHWGLSLHYIIILSWPEGSESKRQSGSWGDEQLCTLRSYCLSASKPVAVILMVCHESCGLISECFQEWSNDLYRSYDPRKIWYVMFISCQKERKWLKRGNGGREKRKRWRPKLQQFPRPANCPDHWWLSVPTPSIAYRDEWDI